MQPYSGDDSKNRHEYLAIHRPVDRISQAGLGQVGLGVSNVIMIMIIMDSRLFRVDQRGRK